ncbi:hypothetical protein OTB20_33375 [Streptomyces sp. H27-H1]|uniref:hypothetical protein n=1 Tax=Streptomyces sp. H27-H1 TaxID=2996461 RepID=UPI00226F4C89|nr:hypothetical protein [Streptomyces sp. H27-H1]MCY0931000.1 hypothetical protein [Streptomyces sp. H27-H1]
MSSTTARRITIKQRQTEMIEAITRGEVYNVARERGAWVVYGLGGERLGGAGWYDWDTARVHAEIRRIVRADQDDRATRPTVAELEAGAARVLAEVRAELAAEAEAAAIRAEVEAEMAADRERELTEATAQALGWTERHLEAVQYAARQPIHSDGAGAYRRTPGGRRISAELVTSLAGGGFLAEADGLVTATSDGVTAVRRILAAATPLVTPEEWRAHAVRVNRALAHGKTAHLLPCLPDGLEAARRTAAARAQWAEYERQAAVRHAEAVAIQARAEAAHQQELAEESAAADATEEQLVTEQMYGCGSCPNTWELAARCGTCRTAFAPAPHVPAAGDQDVVLDVVLDDVAEEFAEHAARDAAQVSVRRPAVRAEVSRHHVVGGRGLARITFPAARAHRARDHRAVVLELAALFGLQTSTPRRLLADGTHCGAELWRQVDVAGPARAVERMLAALLPGLDGLELLATRAARRLGTWRRSLLAILGGHLDALTPDQRAERAREFRTAVLRTLAGFMRAGALAAPGTDGRAALWDQVDAVAAEVWTAGPVDPWTMAAEHAPSPASVVEPVAAAPLRRVPLVFVDHPARAVALAA